MSLPPRFPGFLALPARPRADWLAVAGERLAADPCPNDDANAWVNRTIAYAADLADHWQGPAETLARGQGDCEDFAILKRAVLIARGWPPAGLFLVVGYDRVQRRHHALLWAGGLLLDNVAARRLQPAELAGVFDPMFAYGAGAWLYGRIGAKP